MWLGLGAESEKGRWLVEEGRWRVATGEEAAFEGGLPGDVEECCAMEAGATWRFTGVIWRNETGCEREDDDCDSCDDGGWERAAALTRRDVGAAVEVAAVLLLLLIAAGLRRSRI